MQEIISLSDEIKILKRNEFLKIEGTMDSHVYYIESGSLRVFVMDHDKEQIIRFGYTKNIIAALDSFLTGKPSPFYIQAIKKTKLRVISKTQMDDFLKEEKNKLWIKILEELVVQQIEREIDILTSSPKERYERVLARSPQLFQEIPNKHIANYLRMSPETLSRLKKH